MGSEPVVSTGFYSKVFEEHFPYFLSIGMTYEQFWYKDPHLVRDYIKAEECRQRKRNEEMWLQGLYIYHAIGAFSEILPAFPKRGAKIQNYIEEPVCLTREESEERAERERVKRLEALKAKMFMYAYNQQIGEKDNERNNN